MSEIGYENNLLDTAKPCGIIKVLYITFFT